LTGTAKSWLLFSPVTFWLGTKAFTLLADYPEGLLEGAWDGIGDFISPAALCLGVAVCLAFDREALGG
jgi:hypothetical protein